MHVFTIRSEFQTARHPYPLWMMAAGQLATYPPDRAAACPALLPTQRALLTGHVRLPDHIKSFIFFLFFIPLCLFTKSTLHIQSIQDFSCHQCHVCCNDMYTFTFLFFLCIWLKPNILI